MTLPADNDAGATPPKPSMQTAAAKRARRNALIEQIGQRICNRRLLLGISQHEMARQLGISYQQVQKYESGTNAISAGRLFEVAEALGMSVASLFEADVAVQDIRARRRLLSLLRSFQLIEEDHCRRMVVEMSGVLAVQAQQN